MVSSRDRICQRIDWHPVRVPPERRRLRFSFQFNDVKDPTGLPAPPYDARRRRRAAFLVAGYFRVKHFLNNQNRSIWTRPRPGEPHSLVREELLVKSQLNTQ